MPSASPVARAFVLMLAGCAGREAHLRSSEPGSLPEVAPAAPTPAPAAFAHPLAAPQEEGAPPAAQVEGVTAAAQGEGTPAAAQGEPVPAPAPLPESRGWLPTGSLALRYRGRATDDDQDHELRGLLTLDFVDPRTPWIEGHLVARADLDVDGSEEGSVFDDLSDTYDHSLVGKLYLAYVDLLLGSSAEDSHGTLRIGRQSDGRLPAVLRLDGVAYASPALGEKELELGLYGGLPVHLYDDSSREGDLAYGTFAEGQPWRGGRARLDWMHLEDEQLLGEAKDDLFAIGLWQDFAPNWRLEGEHTRVESEARDLTLRGQYRHPESTLLARLTYHELLETQRFRPLELDYFYETLLDYQPFRQVTASISRELGEHASLDVGYDLRRVSDSDDVGDFNRDWERYYATGTLHDIEVEGLALSLTGDLWDDDERDISSLGADLSYDQEVWSASLGTYYSLYKYVLLELDEREEVRTYYLRGARELSERLRLDLGYELEDDDFETYHVLRVGLLWRF